MINIVAMKKTLIISGIVVVVLFGVFTYIRINTKSHSPEANLEFEDADLKVHIFYNRPFKKGRKIFGGLEPYGKVWRTGANEATYLETNKTLDFGGQLVKPGKYSLWTIPGQQTWTVILNTNYPSWGVNFDGNANYDEKFDAMRINVSAVNQEKEIEQFTISVEKVDEGMELIFLWDHTLVAVPFKVSGQ
jgi:Protein of unknown function (DUF2911)